MLIKTHPFNFGLIALSGLIGIFINHDYHTYLLIDILMLIFLQLICVKINYRSLIIFCLLLTPALSAMFISSYLFIEHTTLTSTSTQLNTSINLTIRLFSLALISFAFSSNMPSNTIILELIQRKIINVKIGFALLAVGNAFNYLHQEFRRIQLAYQMRYQKSWYSLRILFPLLVAAARYAQQLSISIYSRGLNSKRSFYHALQKYRHFDFALLILSALLIMIISQYY